jgi:3-oxocholest-4-en-26-oate---CoA ligase
MMDTHFATILEAVADTVADSCAISNGGRDRSWAEFDDRASRLATTLEDAGVGPGSKVALYLYNSNEYLESMYATLKLRAIPVNVNYRYMSSELAYILENADAEAVVMHTSLGPRVADVIPRLPKVKLYLAVDDGGRHLDEPADYEAAIASSDNAPRRTRSDDDLFFIYTGGTTGYPKGVMYSMGPYARGLLQTASIGLGLPVPTSVAEVAQLAGDLAAGGQSPVSVPVAPLMHGTGLALGGLMPLFLGGQVLTLTSRKFEPNEFLDLIDERAVTSAAIVGDVMARPMVGALEARSAKGTLPELTTLRTVYSSGVMFSAEIKARLLEFMPGVQLIDMVGATEGLMGASITDRDNPPVTGRFTPYPTTKVVRDDGSEVAPGSGEAGLIAVAGLIRSHGYYKVDDEKAQSTFREIDGTQWAIPGDWATLESDGSIQLLGRGSQCINTGGEKVFAEEVEEALKRDPSVEDCLVLGRPDAIWGEVVCALVVPKHGVPIDVDALIQGARATLAGYKLPRYVRCIEQIPRGPNGKPIFDAARAALLDP